MHWLTGTDVVAIELLHGVLCQQGSKGIMHLCGSSCAAGRASRGVLRKGGQFQGDLLVCLLSGTCLYRSVFCVEPAATCRRGGQLVVPGLCNGLLVC